MEVKTRSELLHISVDSINANPENPRMIFDQEKMDILTQSISEKGILVPLIVFREDDDNYIILDGERRWRCAKRLNIKDVPANVIAKPTKIENILRMFNIHNVREDWELMPTALKLGQLMDELNINNERRLNELTSLTIGTIRRCKILLALAKKHQQALLKGELKPDFFIEMESVLKKIEEHLPDLYKKYDKHGLVDLFVDMLKKNKITAVTDFRLFGKVLEAEKLGLDHKSLENLVTRIMIKQEISFQDAYSIVENLINLSQIEQKAVKLTDIFLSINYQEMKQPEKEKLRSTLTNLREAIDTILNSL